MITLYKKNILRTVLLKTVFKSYRNFVKLYKKIIKTLQKEDWNIINIKQALLID